jgi:ABC-type multidrug transport system ATPase subunit
MDGVEIDPSSINVKRKIAFMAQRTDTVVATDTPREAIRFSAKLRLSSEVTDEEINALTTNILKELRLLDVADSRIGGACLKGLSGGEMRRVNLGVELVVRPSIIFLDEVTSGLDSHNAVTVMEVCKKVALSGASVIMTIHQPSSQVFDLMDHLILMHRGRFMYQGKACLMPAYFADRGHPVPDNYNPADWMLQVSQEHEIDYLEKAGFFEGFPIETESLADYNVSVDAEQEEDTWDETSELSVFDSLESRDRVSLWTEFTEQLVRDMKALKRDRESMMLRFGVSTAASVLVATGYAGVGTDSLDNVASFASHVGVVFFFTQMMLIAMHFILIDFVRQIPIFTSEFMTDHYRMFTCKSSKQRLPQSQLHASTRFA